MGSNLSLIPVARAGVPRLRVEEDSALESFEIPPEWTAFRNPEGFVYFHHRSKRISTLIDMRNTKLASLVEKAVEALERGVHNTTHTDLPPDSEVYMELDGDGSNRILYYVVCHSAQQLIWLERQGPSDLPPVIGEISPQLLFAVLYWMHIRTFPNHLRVTQSFVANMMMMMKFFVNAPNVDPSLAQDFPFDRERFSVFWRQLKLIFSNSTSPTGNARGNRYIAAIAYCICDHYYKTTIGLIKSRTGRIPLDVLNVLGAGRVRDSPGFTFVPFN